MKKVLNLIIFLITITIYSQESKTEGKVYDGWTYLYTKDNGDELHYKKFKENYAWFKTLFGKPKKHKELSGEEHTTIGYLILYKFDCSAKELGWKSIGYLTEGGVVDSDQIESEYRIKMEVPFPDTMQEFHLEYYCKINQN